MSRLSTLQRPWFSLAERLGGAGNLYAELMTRLEISEPTAKRLCRDAAPLYRWQWDAVRALFAKQKVKF